MGKKKTEKSLEEDSKILYLEYAAQFGTEEIKDDSSESGNIADINLKEIYFSDLSDDLSTLFEDYKKRELRLQYTGPFTLFSENSRVIKIKNDKIIVELVDLLFEAINDFLSMADNINSYNVMDDPDDLEFDHYSRLSRTDIYIRIANNISEHFFGQLI